MKTHFTSRERIEANRAQLAGWRVLMFDGRAVRSGEAVEVVRRALEE